MRKTIAVALCTLLPVLGLASAGLAQSSVQIQGTLQSVDCQNGTAVVTNSGGSYTLAATGSTAVAVNSTSASFCALQQYEGAPATAWVYPGGGRFLLSRIDVTGPAASTSPSVSAPSTTGLVVGALVVGLIGYFIGRSSASQPQPQYYDPYQYRGGNWGPPPDRYHRQCDARTWNRGCGSPEPQK